MKRFGPRLLFSLLVFAAALTIACSSVSTTPLSQSQICDTPVTAPNTTGTLNSVSLCPATADASSYPNGEVQFVAAGFYTTSPKEVIPLDARGGWGVCYQNEPSNAVSVSSNGLAHCQAGASGTYTIFASDFPQQNGGCGAIGACGGGCVVSGYARLTCP